MDDWDVLRRELRLQLRPLRGHQVPIVRREVRRHLELDVRRHEGADLLATRLAPGNDGRPLHGHPRELPAGDGPDDGGKDVGSGKASRDEGRVPRDPHALLRSRQQEGLVPLVDGPDGGEAELSCVRGRCEGDWRRARQDHLRVGHGLLRHQVRRTEGRVRPWRQAAPGREGDLQQGGQQGASMDR